MEHNHAHAHNHSHSIKGKNLFITIILNIVITVAQITGGIFSGSLALLGDAMHNFSDVVALVIAWFANKLSSKENSISKTFGFKRAEILATLFNASVLFGIGIYLIFESVERFLHPQAIGSMTVIYLAILSIILNALSVFLIKADAHDNMNIKAAYLHLLSDVMTSVAVLVGGIFMMLYEIYWIDSIVTVFIAIYLMKSSFGLLRDSSAILMQFAPKNIDIKEIEKLVLENECIKNIHHIHLWQLNDKELFLEAHIDLKSDMAVSQTSKIIDDIKEELMEHFGISHTTLQVEFDKNDDKNLIKKGCCYV